MKAILLVVGILWENAAAFQQVGPCFRALYAVDCARALVSVGEFFCADLTQMGPCMATEVVFIWCRRRLWHEESVTEAESAWARARYSILIV